MKIATFNVNGIHSRLDRLLEWLAESKPDVACLQELKSPDAKLPLAAIRRAGYGVVACRHYLPNGNPQPGPKFDYKLQWFEAFHKHAKKLFASGLPVVLAGDYNVVPTDADIYNPASWRDDALLQPESRAAYACLLKQGWTDAIRARHPERAPFTFWTYWRNRFPRDAGLRIDHLLLNAELAPLLRDAGVDRDVRGRPGASDHAPAWIELDLPASSRQ